jgi:hypothetical protein
VWKEEEVVEEPAPESVMMCGEPAALSVMVMVAA